MRTHTYYNLTQCTGPRVVYFRSTDVEQKNYHRLLWSVPDEWLYLLWKGDKIKVIDKSSNSRGKIERIFIPVLNDLLNLLSMSDFHGHPSLKHHMAYAISALNVDPALNKKFTFWTDRLNHDVYIEAETVKVDREENPMDKIYPWPHAKNIIPCKVWHRASPITMGSGVYNEDFVRK